MQKKRKCFMKIGTSLLMSAAVICGSFLPIGGFMVQATEMPQNKEGVISQNQLMVNEQEVSAEEADTENRIRVEISYIYVNDTGDNSIYEDVQYVPEGSTWGDFFEDYEICYENGAITDADAANEWKLYVQNCNYGSKDQYYSDEVKNFNRYSDSAYVTYYGMPSSYKEIDLSFEYFENDELIDSGKGWTILVPRAYAFGSDETLAFIEKNRKMYPFLESYCNKLGATVEIEPYYESLDDWRIDLYVLNISVNAPETWKSKEGVEGFAYRLYNVALFRDAEEAGLKDWTNKLQTKQQTAAEVAQGIIFSEEFKNHKYSDEQFVEVLYQTMFGRAGDETGTSYWLTCLENGVSREYVFHGFAESQEFSALCDNFGVERGTVTLGQYRDKNMQATGFIARLYTQMLGRDFDDGGIEYWSKMYLTGQKSIEEIAADGFLHSAELTNQKLDNEAFVTRMYETFLNRKPDEAGLKDWVKRLESGAETRDSLVYGFTNSPEFGKLKAEYNLP